jgi:hypothetical protein
VRRDNEELKFKKTLSYANGYRELGMFKEALEEITTLSERLASRLETLQLKARTGPQPNVSPRSLQ